MKLGFCSVLTLLFIGLKLTGYITWSWVWVFSPIWILYILGFILYIIMCIWGREINNWLW